MVCFIFILIEIRFILKRHTHTGPHTRARTRALTRTPTHAHTRPHVVGRREAATKEPTRSEGAGGAEGGRERKTLMTRNCEKSRSGLRGWKVTPPDVSEYSERTPRSKRTKLAGDFYDDLSRPRPGDGGDPHSEAISGNIKSFGGGRRFFYA